MRHKDMEERKMFVCEVIHMKYHWILDIYRYVLLGGMCAHVGRLVYHQVLPNAVFDSHVAYTYEQHVRISFYMELEFVHIYIYTTPTVSRYISNSTATNPHYFIF